jgi:uncharacterized membrane protein
MIVLETLVRRWYAFAFVGLFFWSAVPEVGLRRALRFFGIAAVLQLAAELTSTRWGVPYGSYSYSGVTRSHEISISNVPLFVPLSFCTVVWAGRSLAAMWRPARTAWSLVLPGAVGAALLDLIIDPMTLRGGDWFLGRLYSYDAAGGFFGVPWSNFGGWVLMSAMILLADAVLEPGYVPPPPGRRALALPAGIAGFFIVVALATGHWAIALTNVALTLALGVVAIGPTMRLGLSEDEPAP